MSGLPPPNGKLIWEELLSPDEVREWFTTGKMPNHLRGRLSYPGIYRFVFQELRDENSAHKSCYVGQGGKISERLYRHFTPQRDSDERRDKDGNLQLSSGWHIRGAVQNSRGEVELQILKIESAVSFGSVILNQNSFDDPFAWVLLENWAILSSEYTDHLRPTNRGISQTMKDLRHKLTAATQKARKRSDVSGS